MKKLFSLFATFALIFGFWLPEAGAQKVVKIGRLLTTSGAAALLGKTTLKGKASHSAPDFRQRQGYGYGI